MITSMLSARHAFLRKTSRVNVIFPYFKKIRNTNIVIIVIPDDYHCYNDLQKHDITDLVSTACAGIYIRVYMRSQSISLQPTEFLLLKDSPSFLFLFEERYLQIKNAKGTQYIYKIEDDKIK